MKFRMSLTGVVVLATAMVVLVSGTVIAHGDGDGDNHGHGLGVKAKPYNPDNLNVTIAAAKVKGAGNPDNTVPGDEQNTGWVLARNNTVTTGNGASADLTVKFPGKSINVTEVGFDRLMGATMCSGGSPRFNVETSAGVLFLECNTPQGVAVEGGYTVTTTRTAFANGWERLRFQISPAANATFLQVLSDSGPGAALVDNINVNGTYIGK
jgi:hypothetical protein